VPIGHYGTMIDKLSDLLSLITLFAVTTAFHLLGQVIAALLARAKIEEVCLFYGRTLFRVKTPAFSVAIGMIPTGGSVKFDSSFQGRSLFTNWFISLSGPLFMLVSSAVALKSDVTLSAFLSGFEQIIRGSIAPLAYGEPLIHTFFERYVDTSIIKAYGLLAAKLAAYNLLLFPILNGGQPIAALMPRFHDKRLGITVMLVSTLIVAAILAIWGIALIAYIFRD